MALGKPGSEKASGFQLGEQSETGQATESEKGTKKKNDVGKLPPPNTDDAAEAAAHVLRKFFNNR